MLSWLLVSTRRYWSINTKKGRKCIQTPSAQPCMSLHSVSRGLLQACTPSTHVCSNFEPPLSPQFLNQAPPGAQQLGCLDFLTMPHLGHPWRLAICVCVCTLTALTIVGTATVEEEAEVFFARGSYNPYLGAIHNHNPSNSKCTHITKNESSPHVYRLTNILGWSYEQ